MLYRSMAGCVEGDSSRVIPAKAGTQGSSIDAAAWVSAFARMTLQHTGIGRTYCSRHYTKVTLPDQPSSINGMLPTLLAGFIAQRARRVTAARLAARQVRGRAETQTSPKAPSVSG